MIWISAGTQILHLLFPFLGRKGGTFDSISVCNPGASKVGRKAAAAELTGPAHLLGDGGDEGGWSGGGDEGESVPRRARRVGGRAQGQPHCDAKRAPDKEGRKKRSIRNRVKRLETAYNVSSRSTGALKQLEYNGLPTMSSD